jgi:FAD/FMN-containing dehydrogenase
VPGTKHVSLGGCVAADIHGKNHHRDGAFGAHVKEIEIVLADRSRQRCSAETQPDCFGPLLRHGTNRANHEVISQLVPVESSYLIVQHHRAHDRIGRLRCWQTKPRRSLHCGVDRLFAEPGNLVAVF